MSEKALSQVAEAIIHATRRQPSASATLRPVENSGKVTRTCMFLLMLIPPLDILSTLCGFRLIDCECHHLPLLHPGSSQ